MTGRRVAFRQCDVERAIRAVEATGVGVARVEIDRDGRIIVVPGKPDNGRDRDSGHSRGKPVEIVL